MKAASHVLKLLENRPYSFEDCVRWARLKFEKYFSNKILQLLHSFPLDMTTREGTPFWSGAKRAPTPITFDPKDDLHLDLVRYASCLWAKIWNVPITHCDPRSDADNDYIRKVTHITHITHNTLHTTHYTLHTRVWIKQTFGVVYNDNCTQTYTLFITTHSRTKLLIRTF